jgi:hypothetical protein
MGLVGTTSKERLIAAFIDHLIAFALMLFVLALVPERFPIVKGVLFFFVYLAILRCARSALVAYAWQVLSGINSA